MRAAAAKSLVEHVLAWITTAVYRLAVRRTIASVATVLEHAVAVCRIVRDRLDACQIAHRCNVISTSMPPHRPGAPSPALDIRIGASTRLPHGYSARGRGPSPRALMLRRWVRFGRKEDDRTTYGGCPLPSTLWQTVARALRQDPQLLSRRADVVARTFRASAPEGEATPALWDAPHRAALIALLRRLDRAVVLRRLLRRGVPVPHLLLYQARGRRYPGMFLVDVVMPRGRVEADRRRALLMVRVPGVSAGIVRLRDRGGVDEG